MSSLQTFLRRSWPIAFLAAATLALAAALLHPTPASFPVAPPETAPSPAIVMNPAEALPVYVFGRGFDRDAAVLYLPDSGVTARELLQKLGDFPRLQRVDLPQCRLSLRDQNRLRQAFPNVLFRWPVTVCGKEFDSTSRRLVFDDAEALTAASLDEIRKKADGFPLLEQVDLTGCPLDSETLHRLDLDLGDDVDVVWTFTLYGTEVCSTDREIDLSGKRIRDNGAQVERAVPWMPHLQKVVMVHCGLTNLRMDELNHSFEGVRFVWSVHVEWAFVRTDSDFFIPYKESGLEQTGASTGLQNLIYCPDLVALDIGHNKTGDISFLSVMPDIQYLIMAECFVRDISLLGTLKDLKWLELFQGVVQDLSPLLQCTRLEHLNICYISTPGDNLYETLRQMTWLKRLWCSGTCMTRDQVASLREELPGCEIWCSDGDESTGSTWRFDEAYYEMRDAFHMYYMDIKGNGTRRLSPEELQAMHVKYWGY